MILRKLLALTLLVAGGCAHGPAAVRGMDATRIQEISDYRLCDAAAVNLDLRGQRYPVIENEIARRSISCAEHIAAVASDCSLIQIVSVDTESSSEGAIFTIRNGGDLLQSFRIYRQGIQSSLFTIDAGETRQFGVAVDPNVATVGSVIAAAQGGGAGQLNECRAVRDNNRFNYRPQAGSASATDQVDTAVPPIASAEQGVRSRATRNVNMRAGPSTGHPVVGLLSAGEDISVLRVVDTWCECMTRGGQRVYLSCSFLSAPPGGWRSIAAVQAPGQFAGGGMASRYSSTIVVPRGEAVPSIDCNSPAQCQQALLRTLQRHGAGPDALAFSRRLGERATMGWADAFRELGRVDLVDVSYPFRANTNGASLMVNGQPDIVEAESFSLSQTDRQLPAWRNFSARHAGAFLTARPAFIRVVSLPSGGQRFVFRDVVATCRACEPLALAEFVFDFSPDGRLTGTRLMGMLAP